MTPKTSNNPVSLADAVATKREKVHTQSLDLSFNELLDMKVNGELNIRPDFQRLFQWSVGKRSRFIESLLLEMPVPPIYVIEDEEGKYLLIDGLQRISSYLHLRGELEALHLDPPVKHGQKLRLSDCDIVPELNGMTFDDLGTALQIRLKRSFIRVEVVRKGSDPTFKYHMFKRLNSGGAPLEEQQIRNCTVRLLGDKFVTFIQKLAKERDFTECTQILSQRKKETQFDQELVLRFFALKNAQHLFEHDIADFLTDYMESVTRDEPGTPFNYSEQESVFRQTFAVLKHALGEKVFGITTKKGTLSSGFGVLQYEAITLGIQKCLARLSASDSEQMNRLGKTLKALKQGQEFIKQTTGGGKNSPGLLRKRIAFVEEALSGF